MTVEELIEWAKSNGFEDTEQTWKQPQESTMFYSFKKNGYRVEVKENWYGEHLLCVFLDCRNEIYSSVGFVGFFGQNVIITIKSPKSENLLNEILKQYDIK
jgi:hypothetical protein